MLTLKLFRPRCVAVQYSMDVSTAGNDGQTDYADFEYQQVTVEQRLEPAPNQPGSTSLAIVNFDVLGDVGGLDNNEVAELVYFSLELGFDGADSAIAGDQNVGGTIFVEGSLGSNITDEALPTSGNQVAPAQRDNAQTLGYEKSDDAIFEDYMMEASLPFDDEANGTGGGGYVDTGNVHERNYRALTGRGPVLDQNDDLTIVQQATNNDAVIQPRVHVTVHCVWDVAETSDAGQRFSLPDA